MLNGERGITAMPRQAIQASACWLAVTDSTKKGADCKNYHLYLFLLPRRHHRSSEIAASTVPAVAPPAKPTVKKSLNRAGATPLFGFSAAQVNRGSLPPSHAFCVRCFGWLRPAAAGSLQATSKYIPKTKRGDQSCPS